jgi:cobalt/nickel transport protein
MNKFKRRLIIGLILLALLSPLGLILPTIFKSKEPFGESSGGKLKKELGYIPKGMNKDEKIWKAPVRDYSLGKEEMPLWEKSIIYMGSGFLGIGVIALGTIWLYKTYKNNE